MSATTKNATVADQCEADEQHKPVEQCELWFWSDIHEKTYMVSELCSLPDELIRQLLSETTNLSAQLHAVTGEINDKKAAGMDWDFARYVRVRAKKNKTEEFKNLVSRELKHREKLAIAATLDPSGEITGLKRKVDLLTRKLAIEAKEKSQKKYEYEKRKKFYKLVSDVIGQSAFGELMSEAAKSAGMLYPGPWVEGQVNTESQP